MPKGPAEQPHFVYNHIVLKYHNRQDWGDSSVSKQLASQA